MATKEKEKKTAEAAAPESIYVNRELSWLKFNERVLAQATDPVLPLMERLRFVSIFTSNLDEFFMVRVGSLIDMDMLAPDEQDNKSGMTPRQQVSAICAAVGPLIERRDAIYRELMNVRRATTQPDKDGQKIMAYLEERGSITIKEGRTLLNMKKNAADAAVSAICESVSPIARQQAGVKPFSLSQRRMSGTVSRSSRSRGVAPSRFTACFRFSAGRTYSRTSVKNASSAPSR